MNRAKIHVPEGMLKAALDVTRPQWAEIAVTAVEAALCWLSENPIVPTHEQAKQLRQALHPDTSTGREWFSYSDTVDGAIEWQRRMFLAPEPEFYCVDRESGAVYDCTIQCRGCARMESNRRGQRSKP